MASRPNFSLKQGVAKTIKFTIKDKDTKEVLDVSSATLTFSGEKHENPQGLSISKADGDFDKTDANVGVVLLPLSSSDLDLDAVLYTCELKVEFSASNIDKSVDIDLNIIEAVN